MNDTTWFLIGITTGVAATAAVLLARALHTAFKAAAVDLATRIDDLLDDPETDDHIEDDIWDRDLRNLLHDTID